MEFRGYGVTKIIYLRNHSPIDRQAMIQSMIFPNLPTMAQSIAVVLPVYNEEHRFQYVQEGISQIKKLFRDANMNGRIYLIDDGSKDATEKLLTELIQNDIDTVQIVSSHHPIEMKSLRRNTKKAGTLLEAFWSIHADVLVFVDADNSFSIEDISGCIQMMQAGYYDVVFGTKDFTAQSRPLNRKVLSWVKRLLTRPLLPAGVSDAQTGLKAFRRQAIDAISPHLHEELGYALDLEIVYVCKKMKLRVAQVPVTCIDREGSHIRILRDSLQYLRSIVHVFLLHRRFEEKS
jgi:glycosyltransferase involved in cell wall biosynthesis